MRTLARVSEMMRSLYSNNRLPRSALGLLLAVTLGLSMLWQWHGRAHQQLDVGGSLDDGYVLFFHEREQNASGLTYRWSQPTAEIRLWAPPPAAPILVELAMLAPPQIDGPQRATLYLGGDPVTTVALTSEGRRYRLLAPAPPPYLEGDIALGLEAPRLAGENEPRSLGVAVDEVRLDVARGPTPLELLRELWAVPFLPLGLLLLAASVWLLRLPAAFIGGVPAFLLAALALAGHLLPGARLVLAGYLALAAAVVTLALLLVLLLRRWSALWPAHDRRARRWLLAIFVVALVTTFAPTVQSDGTGYYAYLRSATIDGDLQFGNEYRDAPFRLGPDPNKRRDTATGHQSNHFSVGPALAWSPLYGVGHLVVQAGQELGVSWQANGYAAPYVVLSMFTSALAGLVTLLVTYQICRRWVGPPVALLAATTLFLGSNLFFYAMREGSFAHSLSAMATSLFVLAWLRLEEQPSIGRWAAVGATAGASILIYWLSVLVLVLPVCTFGRLLLAALREPVARRGRAVGRLVLGGTMAALLLLLVFLPQMLTWQILYGTWLTVPQGGEYVRPRVFQGGRFLFSNVHGMLPWAPAFFFGMLGLPLLWRRTRWLTLALLVAFALYFWYNASHWQWHAGGGFGPRRMTVLTPWYAIGLALLFDGVRRWRAGVALALAALMITWMTLLTMRYRLFLIPHDPGEIGRMPDLSFYFSLEAMPLWAMPGWSSRSFIPAQIRALFSSVPIDPLIVLLPVMALAIWGIFALCERAASQHRL